MVDRAGVASRRHAAPSAWSRGRRFRAAAAAAVLFCAAATGCCLVRPPDAETIFAAGSNGYRTPEAAFETFRVAFGSDLPRLEYLSLSQGFRQRENVSYQTYLVARQKLLREHPLLELLAGAEVVASEAAGPRKHRLVVAVAGRRLEVDLVREDRFQIYKGTDFLADGEAEFGAAVHVEPAPGGKLVTARVAIPADELQGVDLESLTELELVQTWKIDRFADLPGS